MPAHSPATGRSSRRGAPAFALFATLLMLAGCGGAKPPAAQDAGSAFVEVDHEGMRARWFAPPAGTTAPALLVLGGSEGGIDTTTRLATGLHAEGYAVLALAYFGVDELPPQLVGIPLEYFTRGLDYIVAQPGVDASRIGVVGGSKGAEAALLLASRDARVRAVVASTPTDHAWQGIDWTAWADLPSWTIDGAPLPYLRYAAFDPQRSLREMYERSLAEATPEAREAARIPLERAEAALLLLAGEDDALWNAAAAADRIGARLAEAGYAHEVRVRRYPAAGHVVFIGRTINAEDRVLSRIVAAGGTREGNVAAINDAWVEARAFLARHLGAPSAPTRLP